jgi:hypothetical protein
MSEAAAVPMFTGSCLCGAVRYEARGAPTGVNHCHCVQCQRQSGAAMVTWATWPTASFRVLAGAAADYESSPGIKRSFCTRCGGTLFWRRAARDELDVAAGTLDQADLLAPTEHIFVKSRRRWMPLCDGLPAYLEYRPKA